jgi:uncharacterized membrane protein YdbT with pleckstrin-like domain
MSLCPSCGLDNPENASFCSHCGTALNMQGKTVQVGATNKPVAEHPVVDRAPKTVDTADERTLWEEYPSFRTAIPVLIIEVLLFVAALVAVSVVAAPSAVIAGIGLQFIVVAVFLVVLLITFFRYFLRLRSTKYKLTSQRIFVTRGILNKRIDEIELEKYRDIFVSQAFLDRIMGCGDIKVVTGDVTNPTVDIQDVTDPMSKKELIRSAARERQKAIGIVRREDL